MRKLTLQISDEIIEQRIYLIRSKKVMLDSDLAKLYGVTTSALVQAVQRNMERFPSDFMYQLTREELTNLISQFVISRSEVIENNEDTGKGENGLKWGGRRKLPYAFTEQGVAMLSGVLNSGRAIRVNIQIMRTFTRLRELIASNELLRQKIEEMEKKYDQQFQVVFEAIKKMLEPTEPEQPKRRIGFHAEKIRRPMVVSKKC